jgi:hypothetical protein
MLQKLSGVVLPMVEQLLLVERELDYLGWRKLACESQSLATRLRSIHDDFHKQAKKIDVLPRSWCGGKASSAQGVLDSLNELLLATRAWFVRDLELFEAAAQGVAVRPGEQMEWLVAIRGRTTERLERVDHVRDQLLRARNALAGLIHSLQPENVSGDPFDVGTRAQMK